MCCVYGTECRLKQEIIIMIFFVLTFPSILTGMTTFLSCLLSILGVGTYMYFVLLMMLLNYCELCADHVILYQVLFPD